jgi:hypothetical protein
MDDVAQSAPADAIGAVVRRLARPHASGGVVIERSVILAEGATSNAIMAWISDHDGVAESGVARASKTGLHGPRARVDEGRESNGVPRRFVLPAGAFGDAK